MTSTDVHIELDGPIMVVTLDRPKANAIDAPTSRALCDAFLRLRDDSSLRAGILTGAGERFFSAGWDLKSANAGEAPHADHGPGGFAGITELFGLGKPIIAAVNGSAYGGGVELMLAAHLVVAAKTAVFALPEARLGVLADAGGLIRLSSRLPRALALELLLTCRTFSAGEALQWGLVNRVVAPDYVLATAKELAVSICESAPLSIAATLEVIEAVQGLREEEAFHTVRSALPTVAKVAGSMDAVEGARAFMEKRPPVWRGC